MPKSKQRKNRKGPTHTQRVERMQKIHQPDGSIKLVHTGQMKEIVHSRQVMPSKKEMTAEEIANLLRITR